MVKRCIGIDIGFSHLRAVQISRKGQEFCIEKVFSTQTRRTTDLPADIIRSLVKQHAFDRRADVAISMPHDAVFFRNLETDFAGLEQIRALDSSALEHNFPIQPDEIVAQVCSHRQLSGEKYSVLTAAVSRESLHERLSIAVAAKMHPNLVDATILAIQLTVAVNHPEILTGRAIIAYVDESYLTLAVTQNNSVLIVRNMPVVSCSADDIDSVQEQVAEVLSREAEVTWRKVFSSQIEQDTKIYLVTGGNFSNVLETIVEKNLHCQTTIVDPYAKVKCSPKHNGDAAICVAEGLALKALAPGETTGINFLEANNANIKPTLNLKKEFTICAILAAAIAVMSLAGLFIQLSRLETKYTHIKNEIEEVFRRALPEERNMVSPLVQLEQKLQSLQTDSVLFDSISGATVGPVEILHAITKSIPSGVNINIDNILITTESVRLIGTSQSFEYVYDWQQLLQRAPQLSAVEVQDIRREPKSKLVHFTISASLTAQEQK